MSSTSERGSILDALEFNGAYALVGFVFVLTSLVVGVVTKGVYNVWFHPLSKYPGPKLWAFSRLPWHLATLTDKWSYKVEALHQKYGHVVRTGPNDLSYTTSTAWKAIYGHKSLPMEKPVVGSGFPNSSRKGGYSLLTSPREAHSRMRRLMSHAFSDRALREQEGYIQHYVTLLMSQLYRNSPNGPQDMCKWFNFTTFDVIGDLAFGDSFKCLETGSYHPYVVAMIGNVKAIPYVQLLGNYGIRFTENWLVPKKHMQERRKVLAYAGDVLEKRLANDDDRKDFFSYILRAPEEKAMTKEEMYLNSSLLIAAGSETTASLLSGCTYALLVNPKVYEQATTEIRSQFTDESEITVQACTTLTYLTAVLEEGLRWFPPVPATLPRVVPKGGDVIDGEFVPEGTGVGINHWAINRSPDNWHRPNDFCPERWLPEGKEPGSEFYNDDRMAMQSFSYGPRNCLGKNLAYAEMRLIMARLLFNFDLEVTPYSRENWMLENNTQMLWEKAPLMCSLKPIRQVTELEN